MSSTVDSLTINSLVSEADRCVACGLCLPHCPTYRKTGSEADSPRGRIQLMRAVSQGILPNNDRFKAHIDQCLSCRSCESACPNSVNYGALVDATRALHIPKTSLWYRLSKPLIKKRGLQYGVSWLFWLLQFTKLDKVLKFFMPLAKTLPPLNRPQSWKSFYPSNASNTNTTDKSNTTNISQTASIGTVSLFLGCASNTFDQQTLGSAIYILNQLGYDVNVPKQTCCGSIARQMGDQTESQKLIEFNKAAFDKQQPLLTIASGCGAGLQDYLTQHSVQDISTFLVGCNWENVVIKSLPMPIFVQDPCSLRNVQKGHQAVYQLLKKIPQSQVQPLPGNAQCCGGAGAYMFTQSSMANQLQADKLSAIEVSDATILATSNIGCSLHISQGLRAKHQQVSVMHPISILAKQMGYVDAD
jgi:glycolate oxidase iron-sulfur subunit